MTEKTKEELPTTNIGKLPKEKEEELIDEAWDKYQKKINPFWDKFQKKTKPFLDEFFKKKKEIEEKFKDVCEVCGK